MRGDFSSLDAQGPSGGGGALLGFTLVVLLTLGALAWISGGQATDPSGIRVYQQTVSPQAEQMAADEPADIDRTATSSVSGGEAPAQCDIVACSEAYRSFDASDCTFQPYEGPRRLCTI